MLGFVVYSVFVLADISIQSPQTSITVIIVHDIYRIKVSQKHLYHLEHKFICVHNLFAIYLLALVCRSQLSALSVVTYLDSKPEVNARSLLG